MDVRSVCVFCGSNVGKSEIYAQAARGLARAIVGEGLKLVYGGGNIGLMGVLAEAALAAGGHVTGVTPRSLLEKEVVHTGLTDLRVVESMHERKALMAELSDAFIALPGGLGTLEETFEILTWAQLGFHRKPCGVLNVAGFYDKLGAFLDYAVDERFIKPEHRAMLLVDVDPAVLVARLKTHRVPAVSKWIGRGQI
ncbi:MAG: TIGR00730 family Rossman fold protein [Betaproteobacteria bacterium]|nr:TIGR00730 family Rossman fold protein [Betaproteobacteria bacterium]